MVAYWTTFARTGDPNGSGSVPWTPFGTEAGDGDADDGPVQSLSAAPGGIGPEPFAERHLCDFWLAR